MTKKNNDSKKSPKQISNLTTMASAFAKADPKLLERLQPKTVENLTKVLAAAAKEVAAPLLSKTEQQETVKTIELSVTTVKGENGTVLHVKTPFWRPFIYQIGQALPEGTHKFDKESETRIVLADQKKALMKVLHESFGQSKRPVYVTVDGKREQITAGASAQA